MDLAALLYNTANSSETRSKVCEFKEFNTYLRSHISIRIMARGGRSIRGGSNKRSNRNQSSGPYQSRKIQRDNQDDASRGRDRRPGRAGSNGGRGGRGRGRGRGGRQSRSAEDLDREMDKYWGKSEEHANKRLDGDMDEYWKHKDPESTTENSTKTEAQAQVVPESEDKQDATTTENGSTEIDITTA
ncbi:hypothetical protein ABG067_004953 [Albugo candida]